MGTAPRPLRLGLAMACCLGGMVLALVLGAVLAISTIDGDWLGFATSVAALDRHPVTAFGADVLLDLLKVALLLSSAALVVVRARDSVVSGLQVLLVLLLANVSVQLLKHWSGQLPSPVSSVDPLSGHAALVGAVALSWLVTRNRFHTLRAACLVALAMTGTCLIAIIPGQHSPTQVACPLVICLGWALALPLVQSLSRETHPMKPTVTSGVFAACGLVLALLSLVPVELPEASTAGTALRLLAVVAFVAGSAMTVTGAALAGTSLLAPAATEIPSPTYAR